MVSFIVIGKNEGWKLIKSIDSIIHAIKENKIEDPEIIYVDSKSSDGTLERIKEYNNVKAVLIEGEANAAVARNVGFIESTNPNLIFIDGDMEIQADFLPLILDENKNLKYEFCSGNWINYNYESFESKKLLSKKLKKKMTKNQNEFVTGGLFGIKRSVWESVGGMRTSMRRSQDWDLALRLAKKGVLMYRLKEVFAIHHTLPPRESVKKMWRMFFLGYRFYRIVILRNNFFNKYQWKHFIRINYSFILFMMAIIAAFSMSSLLPFLLYFLVLVLKNFSSHKGNILYILNGFIINFLYDILYIFTFFAFLPKKKKLKYQVIANPYDRK